MARAHVLRTAALFGALALGATTTALSSTPAPGTVAHTVAGTATLVDDATLSPDGRLHELTLDSPALGRPVRARVLLPAGYADPAAATRRYPVLHLVHGASGDQSDWTDLTAVEEHTAALDLIVVMPDGGRDGWYSDHHNGPAWESFHIGELVPYVDATYRTVADRSGRAIAGLSMGGFGALTYAARHPDLFGAVASFSGGVDNSVGLHAQAIGYELAHDAFNTPDDDVWGPFETSEVNWRAHNPTDLLANLRWTDIYLATGNGVPVGDDRITDTPIEVGVYAMNLWFHGQLQTNGIAHQWEPRNHGTHAWSYWDADLARWLPRLMWFFSSPRPAPRTFDHDSAEPSFDVWGWRFVAERAVQEFVSLQGVNAAGLQATGTGLLHVLTPPLYTPNEVYRVAASGDVGAVTYELPAGADGRLAFAVDLGPSHTMAQFTLPARLAEGLAELGPGYFRTVTVSITPVGA